jgi:predicted amidohydrolase YtcJ
LIRGGRVVTPWGVGQWDVAVAGEKIVAVAEPYTLQGDVGRTLDASDKIVVPGEIEPHAHIASPVPGNPGGFCQLIEAETLIRRTGAHPDPTCLLGGRTLCPSLCPNSRIDSSSLGGTPIF